MRVHLWSVLALAACGSAKFTEEREICDEYLECVGERAPDAVAASIELYGEKSGCWDTVDQAELCADACELAVEEDCGPNTTCDDFAEFLIDSCGIVFTTTTTTTTEPVPCEDGSEAACQATCGLNADCAIFSVPDDPTDQDYLDAVSDYVDCIDAC